MAVFHTDEEISVGTTVPLEITGPIKQDIIADRGAVRWPQDSQADLDSCWI